MVTNQEAIDKWIHDDNLAQHYLFNTCNEQQQPSLLTCTSAHAIWLSLTSRYQQKTAERRQSLGQELLNYKFRPDNGMEIQHRGHQITDSTIQRSWKVDERRGHNPE